MALGNVAAFSPDRLGAATTITASTTPASAALPATGGESVLVFNGAGSIAFVAVDAVASTNSVPIPAGGRMLLQLGAGLPSTYAPTLSVVLASGSGSVTAVRGSGSSY